MSLSATYYGSNGWHLELNEFNILIDPWLIGPLTFPLGEWFFKGELSKLHQSPKNIDIILLTQGQPDHTHPPTLEKFDKSIPVIGSEAAIKVVEKLGFKNIKALRPRNKFSVNDLEIEATAGAPVPAIENGYIINNTTNSIYIEPHGYLDEQIRPRGIEVVITPVIDIRLPIAGKFIKGQSTLPKLIKLFRPSTIFASTTGGDAKYTGLLSKLIKVDGSINELSLKLDKEINFINPEPGRKYELCKLQKG